MIPTTLSQFAQHPLRPGIVNSDGSYRGWVQTWHGGHLPDHHMHRWNLDEPRFRFGLYALASTWSQSGRWEGPASLLMAASTDPDRFLRPEAWIGPAGGAFDALTAIALTAELPGNRQFTPRHDCLERFRCVAQNFAAIDAVIHRFRDGAMTNVQAWAALRAFPGTGNGANTWKVKIPLIFRELRCHGWATIPGTVCSVPDTRVRETYQAFDAPLPVDVLAASAKIHEDFGDLYDIPAFLYKPVATASRPAGPAQNVPTAGPTAGTILGDSGLPRAIATH